MNLLPKLGILTSFHRRRSVVVPQDHSEMDVARPRKRARVSLPEDQLPSPISEAPEPLWHQSAAERIKARPRRAVQTGLNTPVSDSLATSAVAGLSLAAKHDLSGEEHNERPVTPESDTTAIDQVKLDEDFAGDVLVEIAQYEGGGKTLGNRQRARINTLLKKATRATQDEGPWLSAEQAAHHVRPGYLHPTPIFVDGQQPYPLLKVDDFLDELYDDNALIWIQDSDASNRTPSASEVKVGQVKKRLRGPRNSAPWNCLELACPLEDGTRPMFLNSPECRLLTKIKMPGDEAEVPSNAGRRQLVPGYKEAEKWVLLAEAGALTEPHQDSHGHNTFITVNDGLLGFGWLHEPTIKEIRAWRKKPSSFVGGKWRYVVLRPGHTVYFPAGTVHFVFRLRSAGHTLALGGFVLRCSTILPWLEHMINERNYPETTNEDLSTQANHYVHQVAKFVEQALESGREEDLARWGGEAAMRKFLVRKRAWIGAQTKEVEGLEQA